MWVIYYDEKFEFVVCCEDVQGNRIGQSMNSGDNEQNYEQKKAIGTWMDY